MDLSPLEHDALEELCRYWTRDYPALPRQVDAVCCTARENTGNGFFTDLHVDPDQVTALTGPSPINGHFVRVDGLQYAIGLILFFKDGYLNLLEGYSVGGEDTSEIDFSTASFGKITRQP